MSDPNPSSPLPVPQEADASRVESPPTGGATQPDTERLGAQRESGKLAPPELPGYFIEGEIGRGGMGVVYRARQLSLNRVVALKILRDSALAGPEQLARFRAEAEAVARLQHPNIVQIYDLDEKDGVPFFAMEYVAGGSLAQRFDGKPQPPRQAAELVEQLARAVHYAHQQGIIHRDLKPANVLLSDEWRVASGEQEAASSLATRHSPLATPKITDFGLVKRLDIAGNLTPSSAVMGTPAYMAPEQASGKFKEIGPATDIYALGGILYEALTGKAPFESESLLGMLDQVRFQEPTPPSRVQPDIPADLETICLRCLRKEPERRYPSAAALAEDLQRFLDDRPLVAEPDAPPDEPVGVPGYEVWDEIARGGVWVVHKARDLRGKRLVALKRVRPGSPLGADHLSRLRVAAEEASKLRHPNIAGILDVGGAGPRLHLAIELVEGGSLARKLAGRPLSPAEAARLVELLADAVHHAHEHGLIHCHLQLANVLLTIPAETEGLSPVEVSLGVPKLIGYEMARRRAERGAFEGLDDIRPTSYAMSPEQLFSKPEQIGPVSDVYALGVILYELLTGRPPYQAATTSDLLLKVGFEILSPPRRYNPASSAYLDHICMTCLQREPEERYASAAALADDLRRFQKGERPTVVPPSWWERLRTWLGLKGK